MEEEETPKQLLIRIVEIGKERQELERQVFKLEMEIIRLKHEQNKLNIRRNKLIAQGMKGKSNE